MECFMLRLAQKQRGLFFAFALLFHAVSAFSAPPLTDTNESPFALVYQKVAPSVVWIEVESARPQGSAANPWDQFFNVQPNQQAPRVSEGMGSGVIFDQRGYVLTNNHVVEGSTHLTVRLEEGIEYDATIIGRDPQTDLAVIQIQLNGDTLPPERVGVFGDSDKLRPGDYAIAIGNPMGLERTITVGVIGGIGRYDLPVEGANNLKYQNFLQTDAQINPGNSGGALVNIQGEIIGINNMYAVQYAAIGFAIPINMAKIVAAQLVDAGVVKRGFVGIGGEDITKEVKDNLKLPSMQGMLVIQVSPGLPAEKAGVKKGDVVLSIDGITITNYNDFQLRIGEHMPGDTISLKTISEGKEKTVNITLADQGNYQAASQPGSNPSNRPNQPNQPNQPDQAVTQGTGSWRGITVVDVDNPRARRFNLGDVQSGVVIVSIDTGSPAQETNLEVGEIITEIEGQQVKDTGDFEKIRQQYNNSDKNILIYRMRRLDDGRFTRGYVAVKSQ